MKFAHKIFIAAYAVLLLSFGLGGFFLLHSSFTGMLSARQQAVLQNNDSMQVSFQMMLAADDLLATDLAGSYRRASTTDHSAITARCPLPQELEPGFRASRAYFEGGRYYFQAVTCVASPGGARFYVENKADITDIYLHRQETYRFFCLLMLAVAACGGGGLYWLSLRLTRPLGHLAQTADAFGQGELSRRAAAQSGTLELDSLAGSFNRMAARVESQVEELKEEARRRDDFVASFTHELKTPLTSIIGYADLMRSYELEAPRRREYSDYIYKEGSRLESLSLHLLDLLVLGQTGCETQTVSAQSLLRQTQLSLQPLLARHDIRLSIHCQDAPILANPHLIQTCLYNLADNSRKAMDGPLRQILLQGQPDGGAYRFTVSDTGRGIPPQELDKVTEAFYMVDKSRARRQGGAGLGLALCQKIAQLHGSRLQLQSQPGKGTAVSFTVPLASPREEEPHEA